MILKIDLTKEEYERLVAWTAANTGNSSYWSLPPRLREAAPELKPWKGDLVFIQSASANPGKDGYAVTLLMSDAWSVELSIEAWSARAESKLIFHAKLICRYNDGRSTHCERPIAQEIGEKLLPPGSNYDRNQMVLLAKVNDPAKLIADMFTAIRGKDEPVAD